MKKKLEAELISIAHRILQMKNKSDVNQLYVETQKLYEKLSVLKFVEEHFGDAKPTIGQAEMIEKIGQTTEEIPVLELQAEVAQQEITVDEVPAVVEEIVAEEEIEETVTEEIVAEVIEEEIEEEVVAEEVEEIQEVAAEEPKEEISVIDFAPTFELEKVAEVVKETPKKEMPQISFEELLGGNYEDTLFVKVDHKKANPLDFELPKIPNLVTERAEVFAKKEVVAPKETETKVASLNDKLGKGIQIDLNDRIAFVKHLFNNSNEDYIRVLNQLITFDSFEETQYFIENMVKPDYNNWEGKEDYEKRFIHIIEKKFV